MLEVFAEGGLVGEIELIGHLLYVLSRESKQILGLKHHIRVNDLGSRLACALLYYK